MQKTLRLIAIEKIITGENITSQEALLRKLKGNGIICTQATLSRDLRQLGVSRIPDGERGYRYSLASSNPSSAEPGSLMNMLSVIREIVGAKGLMVIRTIPGNANATAYFIDNSRRYEIAGTIAGDDTILVIPRNGISLKQVHNCLELIMPGLHSHIRRQSPEVIPKKQFNT
ncbi:MAG: ArgR family transcriptional regulator [Bacteroidales bacterium]